MKTKKIITILLGAIMTIALIIVSLLSSLDILIYHTDLVDKEYEKYELNEAVHMDIEDLKRLNKEMFDYLKGDREKLCDITATIDGVPDTPFFNERECYHMADCRGLFVNGFKIRNGAVVFVLICLLILFLIKAPLKTLCKTILISMAAVLATCGIATSLVVADFNKYFVLFHEIFFDNDMWILDESTSRLINIMPLEYFMDLAKYSIIFFGIFLAIITAIALIVLKFSDKDQVKFENN